MTLDEALHGKDIPADIRETLELIAVPYFSFEARAKIGHLVVHKDLAEDVREIFATLAEQRFLIEKIIPISAYGWDDDASMEDNNSSAFNYRTIAGTDRLSNHAFGRAIDINPRLNPYIRGDYVAPRGATYDLSQTGTITPEVARLFIRRGWIWGGNWTDRKDWQHFEKP